PRLRVHHPRRRSGRPHPAGHHRVARPGDGPRSLTVGTSPVAAAAGRAAGGAAGRAPGGTAAAGQEFFVFLPQMRMDPTALVDRARAAEAAGFGGLVGMDHLVPPGAEAQPMYEAMVTNT